MNAARIPTRCLLLLACLMGCGGNGVVDLDGDGWWSTVDCDDTNAMINPGATEIPGDGIDNDCNPNTSDALPPPPPTSSLPGDRDGDGYAPPDDCDETDPDVHPGAEEVPYDGIDNDCDPATPDDDLDGDGFDFSEDCDDEDPDVTLPVRWYSDCDGDTYAPRLEDAEVTDPSCAPPPEPPASCQTFLATWTWREPVGSNRHPLNDSVDCEDRHPLVHPGQQAFFDVPIAVLHPWPFDYDCDSGTDAWAGPAACHVTGFNTTCGVTEGYGEPITCGQPNTWVDACEMTPNGCAPVPGDPVWVACR